MSEVSLAPYQAEFIEFALEQEVLSFGAFTLKSGRISPYFFNAGRFRTGGALAKLGRFYAQALVHSGVAFDVLFGPAYKGIPLASAAAIALADQHQQDVPYVFNRKEIKDLGEGGQLVGADLVGRVMIVDDVITAGTAIGEVMQILAAHPQAQAAGVLIALDRQEKGKGDLSAIQEVQASYQIPVISIINLNQLLAYIEQHPDLQVHAPAIREYRQAYGIEL